MTVQPITADAPMGANIVPGGTTFRVWAPTADAVHLALHGPGHPDPAHWRPDEGNKLIRDQNGYWGGFVPGVGEGALYRFWTVGPAGAGYKRDPRARELELRGYPDCDGVVRDPTGYPWHDAGFRPPPFHELIIYQLHIGVSYAFDGQQDIRSNRVSKFLDVLDRLEYLAALGVNAIQPLPVVEWQGMNSRGYNNTDFFSPEMDHALPPEELGPYLERINLLLRKKGRSELVAEDLHSQVNQLKAMVDLFHVYGLAVILDVVYNHAGGPFDDQSMRFFDRPWNREWWDPDSYFIGGDGWAGGRIFDYGRDEVRNFLIQNALMLLHEFHVDGFRYDEVSVIHNNNGSRFCRDLTDTLRYAKPGAIQIAEYWNWDRAKAVEPPPHGLGFDAALHDGLRGAIRAAIGAAAQGRSAHVDFDAVRDALRRPQGFPASWKAVNHIENHDLIDGDRQDPTETQPRNTGPGQLDRPPRLAGAQPFAGGDGPAADDPGDSDVVHGPGIPRGQTLAQRSRPHGSVPVLAGRRRGRGDAGLPALHPRAVLVAAPPSGAARRRAPLLQPQPRSRSRLPALGGGRGPRRHRRRFAERNHALGLPAAVSAGRPLARGIQQRRLRQPPRRRRLQPERRRQSRWHYR